MQWQGNRSVGKRQIFLPFTIDKRFWNMGMKNVFLNKVYERQIAGHDIDIQYDTLLTWHDRNDQQCKPFISRLVNALGKLLNQYHRLDESTEFWQKMLFFWVKEYVCSVRFKIDQLDNLKENYSPEDYSYYTYASRLWKTVDLYALEGDHNQIFFEETFHFISYLWLAEKYYDVHIEEIDANIKEMESKHIQAIGYKSVLRSLRDGLMKCATIFPSRMRIGTFQAQEGRWSWLKWYIWSKGVIQRVVISPNKCNSTVDRNFRDCLKENLLKEVAINEKEERILEFLPKVFPRFFVEDFRVLYDAAGEYLDKHPRLSLIFTSTGMVGKSVQKICMLLLQKRGGKVLGQQHGGAYNVIRRPIDYLHELELNDVFYFWGRAVPRSVKMMHTISYAPSWKLEQHNILKGLNPVSEFLLYVTTEPDSYPRSFYYGFVDKEFEEYLELGLYFLVALRKEIRGQICFRPYPRDFGWHMSKQLCDTFPEIRVNSRTRFEKLLKQCSLFIVDHISTTWIEALFINKPMIVFTTQHSSVTDHEFWDNEKPYFDMLEEVGIVFYSPEKAAAQVNRIMDEGIINWWMDHKRQQVLQVLRERWTIKVENIDKWWYHELMSQA